MQQCLACAEGRRKENVWSWNNEIACVHLEEQLRRNCKIKKLRAKPDQCCSGQRSGSKKKKKKRKQSEKVSTRSLEVFRIQDLKSAYIRKRRWRWLRRWWWFFLFFCTTLIIAHAIPCFFASSSIYLIPAHRRPRIEPKKKLVQENLSLELDHGMFIVCAKKKQQQHRVTCRHPKPRAVATEEISFLLRKMLSSEFSLANKNVTLPRPRRRLFSYH